MFRVLFLLFLGVLIYYWWRSQQIKEKAYEECLKHCYKADVELLDGTIALSRQWFAKDANDKMRWFRKYEFEFTSTREHRYRGWVQMAGLYVVDFHMEPFHLN
ncbi:DUF3301 domain-containing protein [Pleionea sp. CnH1-48]|uniref:DUF3301 domain-containing protein n=1 Tax=Pleionea sp. CnH1-48 TaxID=2954494 RepID=UPI002097904C|nr:DUF3301 domain-containing protein [Pleionea sp. CnH1-48]MCO7224464.1 DUF3301 domain-containing protein [Pleionea sp. CnH1-48]